MNSFVKKPADVKRNWILIDASENTMGRVSAIAANYLIGKHNVDYTPHVDGGDHVVVINASNLQVTPRKLVEKKYYRHSGHPGSLKTSSLGDIKESDAKIAIELAVKGMLPKNKLQSQRMARLHVYNDANHKHEAQKPQKVEVK